MPIYVYGCGRCQKSFEEIQKVGDDPPPQPTEGCPFGHGDACPLQRQLTTASHRFSADYSSEGRGGYERQGETMIRQVRGKNSANYGTDRSGRS